MTDPIYPPKMTLKFQYIGFFYCNLKSFIRDINMCIVCLWFHIAYSAGWGLIKLPEFISEMGVGVERERERERERDVSIFCLRNLYTPLSARHQLFVSVTKVDRVIKLHSSKR